MFECKYKLELEDCVTSAKYVYKSQRRKRDKVIAVLIPILIVLMIGMLVFDALNNRSLVWDIILLVSLLVLGALYIAIPIVLVNSQKKSYYNQKLNEMSCLQIKIDDKLCVETLYKEDVEMAKNVHNLKQLSSYLEDAKRLILIFNKVEFVCIRKNALNTDVTKLRTHLEKAMAKYNPR